VSDGSGDGVRERANMFDSVVGRFGSDRCRGDLGLFRRHFGRGGMAARWMADADSASNVSPTR